MGRARTTKQNPAKVSAEDKLKEWSRDFNAARNFESEDNNWWRAYTTAPLSASETVASPNSPAHASEEDHHRESPHKSANTSTLKHTAPVFSLVQASASTNEGHTAASPISPAYSSRGNDYQDSPTRPTDTSTLNFTAPVFSPVKTTAASSSSALTMAKTIPNAYGAIGTGKPTSNKTVHALSQPATKFALKPTAPKWTPTRHSSPGSDQSITPKAMAAPSINAGGSRQARIQAAVQPKVMQNGWTDEESDTVLSKYIAMMIVEGKDLNEVKSELGGDLLGVGKDDRTVGVFVRWLFQTVRRLSKEQEEEEGLERELAEMEVREREEDESSQEKAKEDDASVQAEQTGWDDHFIKVNERCGRQGCGAGGVEWMDEKMM